jgi:glycosyltransferase involved in cell wall biosynthesis
LHILWLKTELLHPIDKGGKIRTYDMLKHLKDEHRITYLTLDDGVSDGDAGEKALEYCHELIRIPHHTQEKFTPGFYVELAQNLFSPFPYAVKKYESKSMREAILKALAKRDVDVLVCDFLAPALNVPVDIPSASVLFQHNVEAIIWKRHYQAQSNSAKRTFLKREWQKMTKFEERMCRQFDCVIAVSAEDRDLMRTQYGVTCVDSVPTGVDTEFFKPRGETKPGAHDLVFTGSMDWLPNEDGIRYFVDSVLPLIKQSIPAVRLTVVGRNPSKSLVELSQRDPSIIVTGRVDDVRGYIEQGAAYIVPLRIGGGTRLKIYEAMAMEKPVVSTTVGAEGLPVENGSDIILADTLETFAAGVVKLLSDPQLARDIAVRAAQKVREQFGWKQVARHFAELCEHAIKRKSA